jgi:hypothetical protein
MNRSARVVPYLSTPARWRVLVDLDENDGSRGTVTTVYVRGDFLNGEEARRAGELVVRAWNAGGALPTSAPPLSACEELAAAAVAFLASGPEHLTSPIDSAQRSRLVRGLVYAGGRLADAVDRHRGSRCKEPLHAVQGDHAVELWRKAGAMLARQRGG